MKRTSILIALALLAVLVAAAAPLVPLGMLRESSDETAAKIFWNMRMPRVLMAVVAGAGLAVSGMALQAVFRNPLATPFTLGVASGASLGASVYFHLGLAISPFWIPGEAWFAFAGAVLSIVLVYGLTRARRGFSTATLLLAGVAVNFFFSSLILLMQYLSNASDTYRILRWMMGGLTYVAYRDLAAVLPLVAGGTAIVVYLTHELNLISTGDELAAFRGVEVNIT